MGPFESETAVGHRSVGNGVLCEESERPVQPRVTPPLPAETVTQAGPRQMVPKSSSRPYLEVEDVDALHSRLTKKGVAISDPLTLQWWGDRTFKILDPNGYEIWFYTNVAEPKPPQGAKLV